MGTATYSERMELSETSRTAQRLARCVALPMPRPGSELPDILYARRSIAAAWNREITTSQNQASSGCVPSEWRKHMRILNLAALVASAISATTLAATQAPEMASVEGRHIILTVHAEDMKLLDDPQAWVDKLDRAYEALADLVGAVPFDGEKITITSADELHGAWARAGNPIKWKCEYIVKSFQENVNKGDWLFGIVHEISHNFDLDKRWVWEAEIMANLKMDYVFEKTKAVVFSQGKVCDYDAPDGLRLTDIYRENELARIKSNYMLTGGWGKDPYHRLLAEMVDKIGWEPIKQAFRWLNTLGPDELRRDGLSKRSLFVRAIDEHTDFNLADQFIDWGFSHLTVDVKDPKEAARLLHDRDWNALIAKRPIQAAPGTPVTVRVDVSASKPTRFKKGLGTHAPAEIVYELGGKYTRFESYIGVPGLVSRDGRGTVEFAVLADGRKIHESPMLRGGGTYKQIALDIPDVKELKLIVTDAGDGQSCDQAAWGDARLLDADGKVTYLSDLEPVSAKQGYEELHRDLDIDNRPLEYPYGPYSEPIQIVGTVDGRKVEFQQAGGPEAYEYTFDGFDAGEHLIRLQITDGKTPITQHELVVVEAE
jgi:hypothetical protein